MCSELLLLPVLLPALLSTLLQAVLPALLRSPLQHVLALLLGPQPALRAAAPTVVAVPGLVLVLPLGLVMARPRRQPVAGRLPGPGPKPACTECHSFGRAGTWRFCARSTG